MVTANNVKMRFLPELFHWKDTARCGFIWNVKRIFFTKNYKVLHIAPEQEFLRKFKKTKKIWNTLLQIFFSPIVDVKADVLDLPFEDESYDIVICNHVLEHIVEDSKAMSELYRVMRKGGWGILQVPMKTGLEYTYEDFSITDPKERQKHFGQYDHVRWYGMDYFDRLKKSWV